MSSDTNVHKNNLIVFLLFFLLIVRSALFIINNICTYITKASALLLTSDILLFTLFITKPKSNKQNISITHYNTIYMQTIHDPSADTRVWHTTETAR